MRQYILPFFIPFKGCPFRCIYCDQNAISGEQEFSIPKRIDEFLERFSSENYRLEVAFFGGTFSLLPEEEQIAYFSKVMPYIKKGDVSGIRFSTRPDSFTKELLKKYKDYGVSHIELGVQSLNNKYLSFLKRGYEAKTVYDSIELLKEEDINFGLQFMMGFPQQSYDEFMDDMNKLVELKPNDCRIYPLTVIKGTTLERLYYLRKYQFISIDEAVLWVADAVELIEENEIEIRRIGLPHSVELQKNVVAGLYAPSFADKVRYFILKKNIEKLRAKNTILYVNKKDFQYAIRISKELGKRFFIKSDTNVKRGKVALEISSDKI